MENETSTEVEETQTTPEEQTEEAQETNPLEAEVAKWKALSRKNETERNNVLKERDSLQERFDALNGDLETTRAELNSVRLEATRANVARKYSLSDDVLEFLSGSDEATLTAQAEKLSKLTAAPPSEQTQKFVIGSEGSGATPLNSSTLEENLKNALR